MRLSVTLYTEKLLVELDPGLYFFINQGCLTVDNMDDKFEMRCVEVRAQNLYAQGRIQEFWKGGAR